MLMSMANQHQMSLKSCVRLRQNYITAVMVSADSLKFLLTSCIPYLDAI
jgi:hypothetical protein